MRRLRVTVAVTSTHCNSR